MKKILPLINILVLLAVWGIFYPRDMSGGPVERLQDSFGESPAERREIYREVTASVDTSSAGPVERLARAVALFQLGMDYEDEYVERMVRTAPGFRHIERSDPPYGDEYALAARELRALEDGFPFVESYAAYASLMAGATGDPGELYAASLEYARLRPWSRFNRRLLLISGCRLLLVDRHEQALEAFGRLWEQAPECSQSLDAYSLVDNMKGAGGARLTAEQMLAWARGRGLAGHSTLVELINTFEPGELEQLAYLQIFRNLNRGFPVRSMSHNFRNADLFEKYFVQFREKYPQSPHMREALLLRSEFNYRCGAKSQAISRKNHNTWKRTNSSSRRRVSVRYSSYGDRHFDRVAEVDSLLSAQYPGSPAYFSGGLFSALALFETDDYVDALVVLDSLLAEGPDPVNEQKIRSRAGVLNYHHGDYAAAERVLAPLERQPSADRQGWSRGMLFLGKSRLAMGDSSLAAFAFTVLARDYPYTYYGIRARSLRQGLLGSGAPEWIGRLPVIELPVFPDTMSTAGAAVERLARSWRDAGFYAEAAYIYTHGVDALPGDLLLRFRGHENYYLAQWYHRVLRGFRRPFGEFLYKGGVNLPENFWDVAFINPPENVAIISDEGHARNIPPGLITAMIRQESNFHPRARSHAGAVGLMQLLPSVARRLSRGTGLGRITTYRLYDPAVNIKLGVKFLAGNLSKYDGNIAMAISSYNADPRNLPAWLERCREGGGPDEFDLDLFIELIPLEETYHYNQIVLTNFWRYQELSGESEYLFAWLLPQFGD